MFEIYFEVVAETWPTLEQLLNELGAVSITEAEGDVAQFDEPGIQQSSSWQRFKVTALFDGDADADLLCAALSHHNPAISPQVRWVEAGDWETRWKTHWHAQRYAGGVCVCPSWCEPPADAQHVIHLDPGQAFGTGTHESTTLCIDWLAEARLAGQTVIDYGTGSGVLAIIAARLGASHVDAVDIDAQAVAVAQANVELNACSGSVTVAEAAMLMGGAADVLVANILLEPLLSLQQRFYALLKPGGELVLAGLLETQVETLVAQYQSQFEFGPATTLNGWARLNARRI